MANDSSEAKTESPTPRRLRDARKRGQVAKSSDLSGALSLLATLLCVVATAPWAARQVAQFSLAVDRSFEALNLATVQAMAMQAGLLVIQLSLIPLAVAAVVFLLSQWLQTGMVFSLELVKPSLERINPVQGFRQLVSAKSLVRFVLMLAKGSIIGVAALLVCFHLLGDAIRVIYADAGAALAVANQGLMNLLLWCGGLFVLLGLLDLACPRWQFLRDLSMAASEVKREAKDDQGDGKLKSERRRFAQEADPKEQLAFIPRASLVVVDSHGRAVVLIYRPKIHPVPLCLVRGAAAFGSEILARAQQHDIPVASDTALLAALYPAAQTGMPVPAHLSDEVLAHLRAATSGGLDMPSPSRQPTPASGNGLSNSLSPGHGGEGGGEGVVARATVS